MGCGLSLLVWVGNRTVPGIHLSLEEPRVAPRVDLSVFAAVAAAPPGSTRGAPARGRPRAAPTQTYFITPVSPAGPPPTPTGTPHIYAARLHPRKPQGPNLALVSLPVTRDPQPPFSAWVEPGVGWGEVGVSPRLAPLPPNPRLHLWVAAFADTVSTRPMGPRGWR